MRIVVLEEWTMGEGITLEVPKLRYYCKVQVRVRVRGQVSIGRVPALEQIAKRDVGAPRHGTDQWKIG